MGFLLRSSIAAAVGDWQLAAGHWIPAKMSPVIVHPRPDSETNAWARCCRAPSGVEWRIPISVQGGAWPFHYEILDADGSGAVIGQDHGDTDYGIIKITNPSVGTYALSVKVTDQDLTEVTVNWTLEVIDRENTTYFLWVDATNGNDSTGDGSYSDPFQTFNGWYLNDKDDATYVGRQVFYRAGTYLTTVLPSTSTTNKDWTSDKPTVHVAHPGETAIVDCDLTAFIDHESGADVCWAGFTWNNLQMDAGGGLFQKKAMRISGVPSTRALIFENTFNGGGPSLDSDDGTNSAYIFFSGSNGSFLSEYSVVSHNTFNECDYGDFVLTYDWSDSVMEANTVTGGYTGDHSWGFFMKGRQHDRITIRANEAIGAGNMRPIVFFSEFTNELKGNIEICWNNFRAEHDTFATTGTGTGAIAIGQGAASNVAAYGSCWVYRNNLREVATALVALEDGPFVFENNAVQCDADYLVTDGFVEIDDDSATYQYTDNVSGTAIFDGTTNLLTGAARTANLGTHGSEVA